MRLLEHNLDRLVQQPILPLYELCWIAENQPFAGGYLTKHYGADAQIEAAQIELSYAYYIDHRTFGREAFPEICPAVFADAQQHLQLFFKNLLKG